MAQVARGWYRRTPRPTLDVRELQAADGRSFKTRQWSASYIASTVVLAAGLIVAAIGAAGG